jgi:ABC-type glycerol-3-phosphate transport system permease component
MNRATPLVKITLFVAIILSAFPIYWMFIVATRTNDVVGQFPPPFFPGGELGENLKRLFETEDAHFVRPRSPSRWSCSPRWQGSPSPSSASGAATCCW